MKKIGLLLAFMMLFVPTVIMAKDFNLKAIWTPNAETDVSHYTLYRTDGTRVVITACSNVTQPVAPLPATMQCLFTVTIPDGTETTATFVLQAVDTSGNRSADSDTASYRGDAKPPTKPGGAAWTIILQ